ncbi:hypothetical protein GCM10007853_19690 [Algimonas ampicilliniresistens]|uniref:Uncharacterized protein n=1 Tax=Algimonas ampicilliniresistens TaxID=1298735 RepID=A0ABQ5VBN1_9PROT|nr:hypothetical protein GCM10007853_19690 [Algimonas ampicilliniresistens]
MALPSYLLSLFAPGARLWPAPITDSAKCPVALWVVVRLFAGMIFRVIFRVIFRPKTGFIGKRRRAHVCGTGSLLR